MGYKQFLETQIYQLYGFVCEHQKIIQTTTRPEEKLASQQSIDDYWARIKRYLGEYVSLCRSLHVNPSDDFIEIMAARFPELLDTVPSDTLAAQAETANSTTLLPARIFEHYYGALHEWKELHNILQEVIISLSPLLNALEFIPDEGQKWGINFGLQLWRQARIQLRRLESFSRDIKYIGEPFDNVGGTLKGAAWMVEIAILQNDIDESLRKDDLDSARNLAIELSDVCLTHLYRADKHLRDIIEEIYASLGILLRGY